LSPGAETTVLVVGAGPTGLAVANLLGRFGIKTVVIEQEAQLNDEPRAVSIDDEAMRLLQWIGLDRAARDVVRPGTGTRFYGAGARPLAASPAGDAPLGHPAKNPIDHGAFQRFLLDGLDGCQSVSSRFSCRLVTLDADGDVMVATISSDDGAQEIRARYVLGCDGGRSRTRNLLGIEMTGFSAPDPWLVIDVVGDPHDQRFAMHHGDPARPHVIVPGGEGRCRYEFMLLPGEDAEACAGSFDFARQLLRPYRAELAADEVIRQRVYGFHALLAHRWQVGNVFLLGDAAHMMPPFAGQGLNSGLRDAANLGWKIAAVERGELAPLTLSTYERERRPNAEAMIRFSVRRGRLMMTTNRFRAGFRDVIAGTARRLSWARRRLDHLPPKPYARYRDGLVIKGVGEEILSGATVPQPRMLRADGSFERLDDLLGSWFALIGVDLDGDGLGGLRSDLWERLEVARVELTSGERFPSASAVADADGSLSAMLASHRGEIVVVRPDRFVLGAFRQAEEEQFIRRWRGEVGLASPIESPTETATPARSLS
jgi:3-(3-hydroxy-phenyl)propionate hydroxylase